MKNIIALILLSVLSFSCKKDKIDSDGGKTNTELISLNQWSLDRFASTEGQTITQSELGSEATFLFLMNFEFKSDGEVRGLDKTTKSIIDKGVWRFIDGENAVNVKLTGLDYDFRILVLKAGNLTLQAPTGNFLSGLGDQINLEFSSVNQ
jgi:hypothetical protein